MRDQYLFLRLRLKLWIGGLKAWDRDWDHPSLSLSLETKVSLSSVAGTHWRPLPIFYGGFIRLILIISIIDRNIWLDPIQWRRDQPWGRLAVSNSVKSILSFYLPVCTPWSSWSSGCRAGTGRARTTWACCLCSSACGLGRPHEFYGYGRWTQWCICRASVVLLVLMMCGTTGLITASATTANFSLLFIVYVRIIYPGTGRLLRKYC